MAKDVSETAESLPSKRRLRRFCQFSLRTWLLVVLFLAPWCLWARQFFPGQDLLAARLKRPVQLRFDKTPLIEALDELAAQAKVPIALDPVHLAAVGAEPNTPVTINLCQTVPLRTALFIVLRPLGLEQVPDEKGGLRVIAIGSSGEDALEFDVTDLVGSAAEFDQLIATIESTIAPHSWCGFDGSGVIARQDGPKFSFVVHNHQRTCHRIADMLERARRVRAQSVQQQAQPQY